MKRLVTPSQPHPIINGSNFLISIYHQENQSWQGILQWLDTGKKVHFRSELELMNLIHLALKAGQDEEESLRTWKDDYSLKSVK